MKNKNILVSGLSLFLCFCVLAASNVFVSFFFQNNQLTGIILIEALAFLLPAMLIKLFGDESGSISFRLKLNKTALRSLGFILKFAVALSLLSFISNYAIYYIIGYSSNSLSSILPQANSLDTFDWLSFAAIAVIPAVTEELFMRGALFSAYEKNLSTGACIFITGLCFAIIHGTNNFAGPLLAGFGYAYLTYALDSIWPAILAHLINNIFYMLINRLLSLYDTFGIWDYFPQIAAILFLLFAYFAFRSLESLLEKGYIKHFQKNSSNQVTQLFKIVFSPGFFAFLCAFLAKYVFKLF